MNEDHKQISIQTKRLLLHHLDSQHLKDLFALRSNKNIVKYVDKPVDKSMNDTEKFIKKINIGVLEQSCYYWGISLLEKQVLIGTICLWGFNEKKTMAEIGFELHPNYQTFGYMSEALPPVLEYAFNTLHLDQISGYTHKNNAASIKLLKKNRFIPLKEEGSSIILTLQSTNILS